MKITMPILTLSKGGAQRMLAELANAMAQRGHEVTVVMPPQGEIDFPLHTQVLRTKGTDIQEEDLPAGDIILSNFYTLIEMAERASRKGKGKHVRLSLCYEPAFLPYNHVSFPTYNMTSNLIVLSKWQQTLIETIHGIRGEIVPAGVSGEFGNLQLREQEPLQIAAVFRKAEGGFSWHREQDYLLSALLQVRREVPAVQINMISPPGEYHASPQLQEMKRMHNFQLYTPANDTELNYHYNQSHIFVSSSIYDTISLPALEAMKTGAAVVSLYSGGNMDYCRPGANCLLSYRHEGRLAADILRLVRDTELRQSLARAGENEAKLWTWERSGDRLEEVLQSFLRS
ncbi:glycosyltransferase family 4 protein [Ectobacillus ponti]|uniref:Glycosyltransferase family 4 protein n=1 Tax=Ectobacillus ponti TaxID=2961894 RepID=A0AA41XAA4_9BACI|nr:glycosyltransferase family 4 protein [Ectobacillus ponti]MCP8968341.1 glycosyltransferase family 4 protein [Ectobacillus ponti]